MRYPAATRLAARIGQVIAVLFGLASLTPWGGPMLGFIAIFVFLGAQQELAYAQFRETAQNLRVGQAMITRFQALPISLRVGEIARTLSENNQGVFPFVDEQLLSRHRQPGGITAGAQLPGGLRQFRRAHSSDVDSKHGFR